MENGPQISNPKNVPLDVRWHQVQTSENLGQSDVTLRINNSLCNEKVPFVTKEGKKVSWYICGPTVYDSTHMGHARTFLSFDIIRRILEDYFGYSVFFVMNVTDIDDKIIVRARRNYLVDKYKGAVKDPLQALSDSMEAVKVAIEKQQKKVEESRAEAQKESNSSKQREELENQVAQEELKLRKLLEAEAAVQKASSSVSTSQGAGGAVHCIVDAAGDSLAAWLDAREGACVTDAAIFRAHAAKYEAEFFEDMAALGVKNPDVLTRVTEYVDEIVAYVDQIIKQGLAYESNGSVYFDTKSFREAGHVYGKLCPWAVGSAALAAESEADFESSEKRGKNDFALWKLSKPGEPSWTSPWGNGRPGWHIECSAMASHLIGSCMDIHSGGIDLRFPHHDNELAQAEAYYGCKQWVNYFLHAGHLHIEGLKMSKSLKNFITIREALTKYTGRQIRLLFVLQAWDKPMNFGDTVISETLNKEKQLKNFFQNVRVAVKEAGPAGEEKWGEEETALHDAVAKAQEEVRARLSDNFDTCGAMQSLTDLISQSNVYLDKAMRARRRPRVLLLRKAAAFITSILRVFGLVDGGQEFGFGSAADGAGSGATDSAKNTEDVVAPFLEAFVAFRDQVRNAAKGGASKDAILALTDQVRDFALLDLGVRCEDRPGGAPSVWKLDDPSVLRQERDEKAKKAAEEAVKRAETKRSARAKDLDKWESAAVSPAEFFKGEGGKKYSGLDGKGMPTLDGEGKELSGKAKKGLEKEWKKLADAHEKYAQKMQQDPGFLGALRQEIMGLDEDIARLRAAAGSSE